MKPLRIALTGHRPNKLYGYDMNNQNYNHLQKILRLIINNGLTTHSKIVGLSGMALGADTIWLMALLDIKAKKKPIEIEAHIPCPQQPSRWPKTSQTNYYHLLTLCDKKIIYEPNYTSGCMQERNRGMINHSDYLIAIFNGAPGGTANTINYAKNQYPKNHIIIINPTTFKITKI